MSGDTWFFGGAAHRTRARLDQDPHRRQREPCTSQKEDNAIYVALKRGAGAKLLDLDRVAVLRAGSDFLSPYDGQSSGQPPELRRAGRLPDRARESLSGRQSAGAAYRGQPADVATRRARALTY